MTPTRRRPSRPAARRAARTFLAARAAWLPGFPAGPVEGDALPWLTLPEVARGQPAERGRVDRITLRRATRACRAAPHRFPRGLADAIEGDPEDWRDAVDARLAVLKAALHGREPLPDLEALVALVRPRPWLRADIERVAARPALRPLLEAALWRHWGDPVGLAAVVGWIGPIRSGVASLLDAAGPVDGCAVALRIVELVRAGAPVDDAVRCLIDRRSFELPLHDDRFGERLRRATGKRERRRHLEDRPTILGPLARPAATLGPALVAAITRLDLRRPDRFFSLLGPLLPSAEAIHAWASYWETADRLEREVRRLLGRGRVRPDERVRAATLRAEIDRELLGRRPPPVAIDRRLAAVRAVAARAPADAVARLASVLELLPERRAERRADGRATKKAPPRLALLESWADEVTGHPSRNGAALVGVIGDVARAVPDALADRRAWVAEYLGGELIDCFTGLDRSPRRLLGPLARTLARLVADADRLWHPRWGPFREPNGFGMLVAAIDVAGGSPALAVDLLDALPAGVLDEFGPAGPRTLIRLAENDPTRLARIGVALEGGPITSSEDLAKELEHVARGARTRRLVADLLASGNGDRVHRILVLTRLVRFLAGSAAAADPPRPVAAVAVDPALLERVPAAIHPELHALAATGDDPGRAATRALGVIAPPDAVRRELRAIERILAGGASLDESRRSGLARRRVNLLGRVAAPLSISPERVDRAAEKLRRRLRIVVADAWLGELRIAANGALTEWLGVAPPAEWLDNPKRAELLAACNGLGVGFRRLAARLLAARLGPRPWDLRGDPANAAFLERLTARELDVAPWLDGIEERPIVLPDGGRLSLALEEDPIEVLLMGRPFETCLAPGDFNFFSAVSNAADINKRVWIARDANGTVQARSLVALTDTGRIRTFAVYAHREHETFRRCFGEAVAALARRMGTGLARGDASVSNLLAADWYDDGHRTLPGTDRVAGDDPLGHLIARVERLAPDDLARELTSIAETDRPRAAARILHEPAVIERPELAGPILERLGEPRGEDEVRDVVLAASLARQAGLDDAARARLLPLVHRPRVVGRIAPALAELLTDLDRPQRALRLLRRTRRSGIRGESADRAHAMGRALEALGRRRRALESYKTASRDGDRRACEAVRRLEQRAA